MEKQVESKDISVFPDFPPEGTREADLLLEQWLNGNWQIRRVVYTKEVVVFAASGEESLLDFIPMDEITSVEMMGKDASGKEKEEEVNDRPKDNADEIRDPSKFQNCLQIRTDQEGHNSGRPYYLQASHTLLCQQIISDLNKLSQEARIRKENKGKFEKSQDLVRSFYESIPFQTFAALLIVANFIANASEAQLADKVNNEDGSRTDIGDILDNMNIGFTLIFSVELVINLYANWYKRFFGDGWNVFDLAVVSVSLVDLGPADLPVSYFRLMRAFRVIRIFGRLKALKKIITALTSSIIPMIHAFLIMFVVTCIYSIMGVTFFRDIAPENFEVFDRSFVTMFRVTAGDTWVDSLPKLNPDGTMNAGAVSYIFSYILIVNWVLLQVSVAVLLDNFVGASGAMEREEREEAFAAQKNKEQINNCLEPLLLRLAKGYIDDVDLTARLRSLFKVLDSDGSGGLSSREFCAAMRKLDFKPKIYMSDSDFLSITNNRVLCDENGDVGPREFETIMRNQIRLFVQTRLADFSDFRTTEEIEFTQAVLIGFVGAEQIGALKMILTEQLKSEADHEETKQDIKDILEMLRAEDQHRREDKAHATDSPAGMNGHLYGVGKPGEYINGNNGQKGRWRGRSRQRNGHGTHAINDPLPEEEGAEGLDPNDMDKYYSQGTMSALESKLREL